MSAPNDISRIVAIGKGIIGAKCLPSNTHVWTADDEEFLRANAVSLRSAHEALRGTYQVVVSDEASFLDKHCDDIVSLRNLASGFRWELRAAERQQNMPLVIVCAVDLFKLALSVRRGGLIISALASIAFESIAIEELRRLRTQMLPEYGLALANELLVIEDSRESFFAIAERDARWEQRVYGTKSTTNPIVEQEVAAEPEAPAGEEAAGFGRILRAFLELPAEMQRDFKAKQDTQSIALSRLLVIELGLSAHRAARAVYPGSLSELAPQFIPRVPQDPFTGKDFAYRESGKMYCLYSPGPTGPDCGGRFGPWLQVITGQADLCLDVGDYRPTCDLAGKTPAGNSGVFAHFLSRIRGWLGMSIGNGRREMGSGGAPLPPLPKGGVAYCRVLLDRNNLKEFHSATQADADAGSIGNAALLHVRYIYDAVSPVEYTSRSEPRHGS